MTVTAEQVREHLLLVGETPAAVIHGALVERRERDPVDVPLVRKPDRMSEGLPGQSAGFGGRRAAREISGVDIAEIDHRHGIARPVNPGGIGDAPPCEIDFGVPHVELQNAGIAHDHESRMRIHPPLVEDPGDEFGADAGAVAEEERETRVTIRGGGTGSAH